ncbi:replication initiator protein [Peromfec virus RodF5_7]|uniref:Replication initiator protein n=1 Tax=Peromfec virus RodF5_7 TaxID=2929343 RepID=A0A976R7F5_9VIRU|nr:replication initiator protein [Peromfec virus RodF5_7]
MCLFPKINLNVKSPAYIAGIREFDCGVCPECLAKKARQVALRAVMEASEHDQNCMCTLTYDDYIRNSRGEIVGERVSDLEVCKRDVQLFIKRLRKKIGVPIKYRVAAEYGKRTHRPHYHILIFGFCFPDCIPYKKSKRGNFIYQSPMLTKLWGHGICTVDSKSINASVAKYCTKYTMKDHGAQGTFSLCSRGIGEKKMLRDFNGLYYVIEGQQYPIPRQIWEKKITEWYQGVLPFFDTRYRGLREYGREVYNRNRRLRRNYRYHRDNDPDYQKYIAYWRKKAEDYERNRPPILTRILALDDEKYFEYKNKALEAYSNRTNIFKFCPPRRNMDIYRDRLKALEKIKVYKLPFLSRPETANDTILKKCVIKGVRIRPDRGKNPFDSPSDCVKCTPIDLKISKMHEVQLTL